VSQPTEIYTTSAVSGTSAKARVGLWLTPQETTDGVTGYPAVGIYVTSVVDLSSGDTVYPQIINSDVYVYGMYKLWSAEHDIPSYANNRALAEDEMNRNVEHVKGLQVHKPVEILSLPLLRRSRVV
jgi:hypothetical protein